jgi:hypothetical protein
MQKSLGKSAKLRSHMSARQRKVTYNVNQVLALAIAAYDLQGQRISKRGDFCERSQTYLNEGNRELVVAALNGQKLPGADASDLADRATEARGIIERRVMMNLLSGRHTTTFHSSIHELLQSETCQASDLGILVWAPKVAADIVAADAKNELLSSLGLNSSHIGTIGKRVSLKFTTVNQRFIREYNNYSYQGTDEAGNMVSFFFKKPIPEGSTLTARVKAHDTDGRLAGAKVTKLHFVKIAREAA